MSSSKEHMMYILPPIPSKIIEVHCKRTLNRFGYNPYNTVGTINGPLLRGPNGEYFRADYGRPAYNPEG